MLLIAAHCNVALVVSAECQHYTLNVDPEGNS